LTLRSCGGIKIKILEILWYRQFVHLDSATEKTMKKNYMNVKKVNDLNIRCEENMSSCDVDFSLFLICSICPV